MRRLKKRAEFLAVARGVRSARRGFVLQSIRVEDAEAEPRCGFTVTKKVGNSVVRNRVRRRLREALRLEAERVGRPGHDHVLIGRRDALVLGFAELRADLAGAFAQARKALARAGAQPTVSPARDGAAPASPVRDRAPSPARAPDEPSPRTTREIRRDPRREPSGTSR